MERSPDFYEQVWAAAYAAAHVSGDDAFAASLGANAAVESLRDEERAGTSVIERREELFRIIRAESTK